MLRLALIALTVILLTTACSQREELALQGASELAEYEDSMYFQPSALSDLLPTTDLVRPRRRGTASFIFDQPPPAPTSRRARYTFGDVVDARSRLNRTVEELVAAGASGCLAYDGKQAFLEQRVDDDAIHVKVAFTENSTTTTFSYHAWINGESWGSEAAPPRDCRPID